MIINQRKMKREHQDDSSSSGINQRKMKRDHQDSSSSSGGSGGGGGGYGGVTGAVKSECSSMPSGKAKMCWAEEDQESVGGGMDELLAVLGYKVRASDMAEVAQKLEQLEMVLGSAQEDGSISHLSDTVHFNPSDLSGWVESMLCELNPNSIDDNINLLSNPPNDTGANFNDNSEYDLRAIPGVAAFPPEELQRYPQQEQRQQQQQQQHNAPKRLKTASMSPPASAAETELIPGESARPVVLVDSQDAGVRLVHTLMACAEAVQQNDLKLADALVKHVGILAASQPGAMRKVATHFAEALARRIYGIYPHDSLLDTSYADMLQMHFYETCPYLKFAHFTANQAILEAFASASRVHVIDFGLKQGMQWPALMQALALRPGGPPAFRLTGIGPPQSDGSDALQQVGWKLAQLAETIGVEFEFRGFVANSLADLEPAMLDLRPPEVETVAVNSVFELHRLLARPGAVEKVLKSVRAMRPRIFTVVEQEASHNGPVFRDRFTEALHYYSTMFDSLEISPPSEGLVMSEVYLGKQICNVVACEGSDRVERHEKLDRWRERLGSAGFDPVHLGSNAFKQASMLLAIFAGREGYMVEENGGCLMLDWHTRPLIATSAWQLAESR